MLEILICALMVVGLLFIVKGCENSEYNGWWFAAGAVMYVICLTVEYTCLL